MPLRLGGSAYSEAFGSPPSRRDLRRALVRCEVPKDRRVNETLGFGTGKSSETRPGVMLMAMLMGCRPYRSVQAVFLGRIVVFQPVSRP